MQSGELLSSIIGDIYDCVLNPELWTGVMVRITGAFDAAYSTIALVNPGDNRARFAAHSPWDAAQLRMLRENYSVDEIPGVGDAVRGDIDMPMATLSGMTEAELQQTPFFQNWARPQGLREACTTKFVDTPDRIGLVSCTTRASRGPITADELRFMALLSPHLRRASLIGDLLDQARVDAAVYRAALDDLAVAILLTAENGAILYANAMAQTMLAAQQPISARKGVLHAQNPLTAGPLLEAIARAAHADNALGARGIGLPISAINHPPAVAYVLPLTRGTARGAFHPACAGVFISTTTSASPPPEAVLISLFDLTPAEVRVFQCIGGGMKIAACIGALGIGENTLKTHLGRIYAKTGTTRQAELVALLSSIRAPISAGPAPLAGHLSN